MPPIPEGFEKGRNLPESGAFIIGDKGVIMHGSHGADGVRIIPESKMQEYNRPAKTITRVQYIDLGKRMVLFFGDEYIVYNSVPGWSNGEEEIELDTNELGMFQKKELGLVTADEYKAEQNRLEKIRQEQQEKKEREQYKRLRRKYEKSV